MQYKPKPYPHDKSRSWEAVESRLRAFMDESDRWPVVLAGRPGTGKTCALLAMLDRWQTGGRYYTGASAFADRARAAMMGNDPSYSEAELWDTMGRLGLLCIDELGGRDRMSDHEYRTILRLLDCREGKPTVIATNLTGEQIAAVYDQRILSRLLAGRVYRMGEIDRRVADNA